MVDELQLESTYIPHLRTQFSRANVVLFTGAGFSLDAVNHCATTLPRVCELTESLWNICYPGEGMDEGEQLQDVFEAALQADRNATGGIIREMLTVNVKECPEYYADILTMTWHSIYTLNVDDLAEKTLERHQKVRRVNSVSATTGRITQIADGDINVVHLNGGLEDAPDNITFSRSQYASRLAGDPFYDLLRHDLISRPVVFIGSSLEEGPMWQHLAMRGRKPERERELRRRSYLVTPSLPKTRQALLSQYHIVWLPYTAEEFRDRVISEMNEARAAGIAYIGEQHARRSRGGAEIIKISNIGEGTKEPTDYLLGAEPQWVDATHRRIAERDSFDAVSEDIDRLRAKTAPEAFIIVTGTAGTGKSSAMMSVALRKEAEGVPTAWVDARDNFNANAVRDAIEADKGLELLFITDADLWGRRVSQLVRELSESNPRLVIVCECRSTKVDRMVDRVELGLIEPIEFTIPYLGDNDIDAILEVLDRENRLGQLKGKTHDERRVVFEAEAGRQMLVAMYKATHGVEFRDRAADELNEMGAVPKYLYCLITVAHAHRFMLNRDELAIACGDDITDWPRALENLVRRKVVLPGKDETFKARHREIAQFVYNELAEQGSIADAFESLIRIAGTRSHINMKQYERPKKMLSTFISHNLLQHRVGVAVARRIYADFEALLSWDHHYWLHRGALELENDNLGLADNFLNQAKSLAPGDVFVDNELAYLMLKKANNAPRDMESPQLVKDALATLEGIAHRRPDQRAHAAHIAGSQGLIWSQRSDMSKRAKQEFLEKLQADVNSCLQSNVDGMLAALGDNLKRELLSLAVTTEDGE